MKKVCIQGNSNIKKIVPDQYDSTRKDFKKYDISDEIMQHTKQIEIINKLYLNVVNENEKLFNKFINEKLSSYKQQDIKNKIYGEKFFVTNSNVVELLVECKLKCYYCNGNVGVVYKEIKDKKQWTLDRINNDMGHNSGNLVISCLDCNLKRRNTDMNKFLFTKKLNIIKN